MERKKLIENKYLVFIVNLLIVGLIGLFDFQTGNELNITILYLIPICIVTWFIGDVSGMIIADLCAGAYLASDLINRQTGKLSLVYIWNAVMFLVFFSVLVVILARLKKTLDREKNHARVDFLTGILNLKGFYDYGLRESEKCKRYGRPIAIAYIDCDNFKQINDTLGHHTGDKLLKTIAETMVDNLRNTDIAARLGGDEFAIMITEIGPDAVKSIIERVRKNLLSAVKHKSWKVTFSVGVVIFNQVPDTLEDAVKKADEVMYKVKKNGKNSMMVEIV